MEITVLQEKRACSPQPVCAGDAGAMFLLEQVSGGLRSQLLHV